MNQETVSVTGDGANGGAVPGDGPSAKILQVSGMQVRLPSEGGERLILDDINLEIAPGEIVGLLGPSGTGKTTLLRVLGGLLRPTGGTVLLDGRPVTGPTGEVVTVFQDYASALLPWRTVRRNVALGLEGRAAGRAGGRAGREERVSRALRMVGLEDRAGTYPWRLSGGMQQRVQIARALVLEPRVLLMDEPFGALDAITKAALHDQLLQVQANTGTTIVFITHDIDEAVYLADRIVVVHGSPGRMVHTVEVDLPRPRDQIATRDLPRYGAVRHELGETLRHGADL